MDKLMTCVRRQSPIDSTNTDSAEDNEIKYGEDSVMIQTDDKKRQKIYNGTGSGAQEIQNGTSLTSGEKTDTKSSLYYVESVDRKVPNGTAVGDQKVPNGIVAVGEMASNGAGVGDQKDPNSTVVERQGSRRSMQWTSSREFLLTCLGYAVGLGNIWRFPYLCYKNGGGAFLIPYTIMIVCIGIPLLFMEYVCGQYFGIGSLSIFKAVCPLFKGIGVCHFVLNSLVCIYYNIIVALSLYYIFSSFHTALPWSHCNNTYNTPQCGDPAGNWSIYDDIDLFNSSTPLTTTEGSRLNMEKTGKSNISILQRSSPSEEFFRLGLMGEEDDQSIGNIGAVRWKLCLCLLLAWILVAIFVSRGIKSSGKVSYLTTTFPYVMLTVLVVRGVTLDGAMDGILYFIVPQWDKLLDADVWFQASVQMFYALNLAWGGMITMSSYNQFNHNCCRDAIIINLVSFGTSLYAGIAVFAIIGYMAHEQGLPIDEVIKSGPGLAFVAYPRALSLMPASQFFSVAFFFMLFLLGIGSQMVGVETVITGIMDTWKVLVKKWQYRIIVIAIVCTVMFLIGIPCTTQGGMYVLQLMDYYSAGFSVLIFAVLECVIFNWIYGHEKMKQHVMQMLNYSLGVYWSICWKFFSPALIVIIAVFSFIKYTPVEYGGKSYPDWAEFLGWCMALASILPIVVVALYVFIRAKGDTLLQKLKDSTTAKISEETTPEEEDSSLPHYTKMKHRGRNFDEEKMLMNDEWDEMDVKFPFTSCSKLNGLCHNKSAETVIDKTVTL